MQTNVGETFSRIAVNVDGNSYERCTFEECQVIYSGGELPTLINCRFDQCEWKLEGSADRTVAYLKALYHGIGDFGKELVENTFENIRTPYSPDN